MRPFEYIHFHKAGQKLQRVHPSSIFCRGMRFSGLNGFALQKRWAASCVYVLDFKNGCKVKSLALMSSITYRTTLHKTFKLPSHISYSRRVYEVTQRVQKELQRTFIRRVQPLILILLLLRKRAIQVLRWANYNVWGKEIKRIKNKQQHKSGQLRRVQAPV